MTSFQFSPLTIEITIEKLYHDIIKNKIKKESKILKDFLLEI